MGYVAFLLIHDLLIDDGQRPERLVELLDQENEYLFQGGHEASLGRAIQAAGKRPVCRLRAAAGPSAGALGKPAVRAGETRQEADGRARTSAYCGKAAELRRTVACVLIAISRSRYCRWRSNTSHKRHYDRSWSRSRPKLSAMVATSPIQARPTKRPPKDAARSAGCGLSAIDIETSE